MPYAKYTTFLVYMCLIFVYYYVLNLCLISIIIKPSNKERKADQITGGEMVKGYDSL